MEDLWLGEQVGGKPRDPLPRGPVSLAAAPKHPPPLFGDEVAEGAERSAVGRYRVVVEVPGNDLPQPFALFEHRLVHTPSHSLLHGLQFRPHAVFARLAPDLELALLGSAADEGEAEEVEGLRLAEPAPPAVVLRMTSELDQPGFLRVQ
ncbi:hypothetical protein [Bradyrhizobium sp. DASA03120]|uniref:hypothetical protein n=1 Tax=Bradyrhizobium sp. SMVTL-02 TaxID=3395917 RepID=UPI003F702C88